MIEAEEEEEKEIRAMIEAEEEEEKVIDVADEYIVSLSSCPLITTVLNYDDN